MLRFRIVQMAVAVTVIGFFSLSSHDFSTLHGIHIQTAEAGSARVSGRRMHCARATVRMSRSSPGVGYATSGLIVLNPRLLKQYPSVTRRMIFLHECAHHYVGASETAADCWAVKRAKRQGWLTERGVRTVCRSFAGSTGGGGHVSGSARCRAMLRCYRGK